MRKIKKTMTLILAMCMVIGLMSTVAYAGPASSSTATGTYEDMHQVAVGSTIGFAIEADGEAYVQVADNDSTIVTAFSMSDTWYAQYGRNQAVLSLNADEMYEGTLTMASEGYDFFYVKNTSTEEAVYIYVSLSSGSGEENDGSSIDKAVEFVFPENPMWMGGGISNESQGNAEISAESQGFYYEITALEDGYVSVKIEGADDGQGNELGWMYSLSNVTKSISSDTHWSDDETVINYEKVKVSKDDKVILFVNTYNPNDEFNAPVGTVYFTASWGEKGTEYGADVLDEGTHTVNGLVNDYGAYDPYFVEYLAEEDGSLIFTVSGDNGWFYTYNYSSFYSYDEVVNDTWEIKMKAGERVNLGICAYDVENYANTDKDANITFKFVPATDVNEVSVTDKEVNDIMKDTIVSGALFGKEFTITQISAQDVLELIKLEATTLKDKVYEAVDLTLWGEVITENGDEIWDAIQPTSPITITMPLVAQLKDAKLIEVSRLEDGALVSLGKYDVVDGKITVSFEHFSTFVFADVTPAPEPESESNSTTPTTTPNTGNAGNAGNAGGDGGQQAAPGDSANLVLLFAVAAVAGAVVLTRKKTVVE